MSTRSTMRRSGRVMSHTSVKQAKSTGHAATDGALFLIRFAIFLIFVALMFSH